MRLGSFAPAGATTGFALWIPTTFEKVDETFIWGALYAATAAAYYTSVYSKFNAAALIKNKKSTKKVCSAY